MLQTDDFFAQIGFDIAEWQRRARSVAPRGAKSTKWDWVFRWCMAATRSRLFGPGPFLIFSRAAILEATKACERYRKPCSGFGKRCCGCIAALRMAPENYWNARKVPEYYWNVQLRITLRE